MRKLLGGLLLAALVSACSTTPSQNQYGSNEVGQAITIEYALVVTVKQVDIMGNASAMPASGASLPGPAYISSELGGIIQSAGSAAQQAEAVRKGYVYTIVTEDKATKTVVQYQNPGDVIFQPGNVVMLQETGTFHRLLSTADLPERVLAPHRKKLVELYEAPPPPPPEPKAEPVPPPHAQEAPHSPETVTLPLPAPGK